MSQNSLVEISTETLPILRDKFLDNWPTHIIAFSLIDNLISRFDKNPKSKEIAKVYSLNGNLENGTFVAVMRGREVLFATLDSSFRELKTALKLLDFSNMIFFMCVRAVYRPVIYAVVKEEDLQVVFDDGTVMTHLKKEDANKFHVEIPENFSLRCLKKENAFQINSVWPHKNDGSEVFIEYMIENNTNVGLFNESNELVAWCLKLDTGSLAALQVDENHFRKGYGEIIAKAISKKIAAECDVDINANIIHSNFKSKNLFQKLGFQEIDNNFWIGVKKE